MPHGQAERPLSEVFSQFKSGINNAAELITAQVEARKDPSLLRARIEQEYALSEGRGMVADLFHVGIDTAEKLKQSAQEASNSPAFLRTERVVTTSAKTAANVAAGVFALTGCIAINSGFALYDGAKKASGAIREFATDMKTWRDEDFDF